MGLGAECGCVFVGVHAPSTWRVLHGWIRIDSSARIDAHVVSGCQFVKLGARSVLQLGSLDRSICICMVISISVSFWLLNELTRRIYENEVVLVRLTRQSTNEITTIYYYIRSQHSKATRYPYAVRISWVPTYQNTYYSLAFVKTKDSSTTSLAIHLIILIPSFDRTAPRNHISCISK